MLTRQALPADLPRIEALLNALGLPVAGVAEHLEHLTKLRPPGESTPGASILPNAPFQFTRSARPTNAVGHRILMANALEHLRLAADGPTLLGMAGLERRGPVALLRSVAVTPAARGQGLAARLVGEVLDHARLLGLEEVYLLTTTAATYFPRLGFAEVPRSSAPAALLASQEFRGACPQTATLMHLSFKELS